MVLRMRTLLGLPLLTLPGLLAVLVLLLVLLLPVLLVLMRPLPMLAASTAIYPPPGNVMRPGQSANTRQVKNFAMVVQVVKTEVMMQVVVMETQVVQAATAVPCVMPPGAARAHTYTTNLCAPQGSFLMRRGDAHSSTAGMLMGRQMSVLAQRVYSYPPGRAQVRPPARNCHAFKGTQRPCR